LATAGRKPGHTSPRQPLRHQPTPWPDTSWLRPTRANRRRWPAGRWPAGYWPAVRPTHPGRRRWCPPADGPGCPQRTGPGGQARERDRRMPTGTASRRRRRAGCLGRRHPAEAAAIRHLRQV